MVQVYSMNDGPNGLATTGTFQYSLRTRACFEIGSTFRAFGPVRLTLIAALETQTKTYNLVTKTTISQHGPLSDHNAQHHSRSNARPRRCPQQNQDGGDACKEYKNGQGFKPYRCLPQEYMQAEGTETLYGSSGRAHDQG
jgi:hypothetical protein